MFMGPKEIAYPKVYKINARVFLLRNTFLCIYPEFLRALQAHTLAFQRALLNFQGLRAQGPFLFETLMMSLWYWYVYVHGFSVIHHYSGVQKVIATILFNRILARIKYWNFTNFIGKELMRLKLACVQLHGISLYCGISLHCWPVYIGVLLWNNAIIWTWHARVTCPYCLALLLWVCGWTSWEIPRRSLCHLYLFYSLTGSDFVILWWIIEPWVTYMWNNFRIDHTP